MDQVWRAGAIAVIKLRLVKVAVVLSPWLSSNFLLSESNEPVLRKDPCVILTVLKLVGGWRVREMTELQSRIL